VGSTDTIILDVILFIVLPAVVGYLVTRWAGDAAKRRGWSPVKVRVLRVVITIVWVAVVIAGTAATLGSVSFLSALTVSAVAGIAVTLALQTTLQNILAGFILIQQRFLHLGDVIQFSGVKGTVVGIGLVEVVLRTESGALAMVSYSNLIAGPMINFTATQRLSGEY
jgi:small-conductance mechanosensitive channel